MSTSVNDLLDEQIAAKQAAFYALSDLVWDTPETKYLEYQSAAAHKALLEKDGFRAQTGLAGLPTAAMGEAGEGGSSKGFMVRAGVFDDVDIAISWHPTAFTGDNPISLTCNKLNFHFSGPGRPCLRLPHLGCSALDAVELMNVGVNYLREHMPSTARIHYAVTDTGGHSPNVVQAKATVRYLIRSRTLPDLLALVERVKNVARGAALMTETTLNHEVLSGDANLVGNTPREQLMHRHIERLGSPRRRSTRRIVASPPSFSKPSVRTISPLPLACRCVTMSPYAMWCLRRKAATAPWSAPPMSVP